LLEGNEAARGSGASTATGGQGTSRVDAGRSIKCDEIGPLICLNGLVGYKAVYVWVGDGASLF
jgi:hypothetical protein